ncbi:hypothetical protein ACEPAF_5481 [Sanghuangporus sanghuang]
MLLTHEVEKCLYNSYKDVTDIGHDICCSSSDDSVALDIQFKHSSLLLSNPIVGVAKVNLVDLLSRSSDGEVAFCIYAPTRVATPTGSIVVHFETIVTVDVVDNRIGEAVENVQKSGVEADNLLEVVEPHPSSHDDLYKGVGVLLERLDTFRKCMAALSEIHLFIAIAWSLTSALYAAVQNISQTDRKVIDLVHTMSDAFEFVQDVQALRDKVSVFSDPSMDFSSKPLNAVFLFVNNKPWLFRANVRHR